MTSFDWRRSTAVRVAMCVVAGVVVLLAVTRSADQPTSAAEPQPTTPTTEQAPSPADVPEPSPERADGDWSIMDQLGERFGFDPNTPVDGDPEEATPRPAGGRDELVTPTWVQDRYRFSVLRPAGWAAVEGPASDSVHLSTPDEAAAVVVAGATLTDGGLETEIDHFRAEADRVFHDYQEDAAGPATIGGLDAYVIRGSYAVDGHAGVFEVRWLLDGDSMWKATALIEADADDTVAGQAAAVLDSVTVQVTA